MQPLSADPSLSPGELAAWTGFLRTHATVIRELDEELRRTHGLPLTSYDVLIQLSTAGDGSLRMSELAEAVLLSRSGLTRLVDRLEGQGQLERRDCPTDARGSYAAITDAGRERLAAARPTHLEGVRRLVLSHLKEREQEQLADFWRRMLHAPD